MIKPSKTEVKEKVNFAIIKDLYIEK